MYCRTCYADLRQSSFNKCYQCGRRFDPGNPKTFLLRPFPGRWKIAWQIIGTTILGIAAAFVVALHQAAQWSGH